MSAGAPARGDLILTVGSASAFQGSSGNTLEVDLSNSGSAVNIAAFSFEISVNPSSGIDLTGATTNTVTTYIFDGNSAFGPSIATLTGTTLDASDAASSQGQRTAFSPCFQGFLHHLE